MKKKILLSVAIIAFCAYNAVVLSNAFALDFKGLFSPPALASTPVDPDGPDSPGGPGKPGFSCTGRGGTEMPEQILRVVPCRIKIAIGLGEGVKFEKVDGQQCQCVRDPRGYEGEMGCDLTWETSCVANQSGDKT